MPVKSRGQLLAGMVTLLGSLCALSTGCHMPDYQQDAFAIRSGGGGGCGEGCSGAVLGGPIAVASTRGGSASPSPRKPLFPLLRRAPQENVAATHSPNDGRCSAAMVLRPVPAGSLPGSGTATGAWQPVQRVGAESPVLERPVTSPYLRVASAGVSGPSISPLPLATAAGGPDGPIPELPMPRPEGKAAPFAVHGNGGIKGAFPAPGMQLMDAPREFQKRALSAYIIEPPDILRIEVVPGLLPKTLQPVSGPHLVRPDGTVGLGIYGDVFVAGRTLEQARLVVAQKVLERIKDKDIALDRMVENVQVDVAVFNSKFYYVITDGAGYGEQVVRIPCTGNEMVLDALAAIQGLPPQASKKKIWIARATPGDYHHPHILPVDWCGITQRGAAATNYQVFPGDRIYVQSDKLLRVDSALAKLFSPIERIFGVTLLGSSTVNSIRTNGQAGGGFNR